MPNDFPMTLQGFAKYHTTDLNNAAHYFTTPLGIVGFLSLVSSLFGTVKPSVGIACVYMCALAMDTSVPRDLVVQTSLVLICSLVISCYMRSGSLRSLLLLALGYGLQDLAHWWTGEETFQQNTWGAGGPTASALFFEHVFYLEPLVLATQSVAFKSLTSLLPLLLYVMSLYAIDDDSYGNPFGFIKVRALFGHFGEDSEQADMTIVRNWAIDQNPIQNKTSHWWVSDLGKDANAAFRRLEKCKSAIDLFRTKFSSEVYAVDVVHGMNELYISGPNRKGTSDEVFFTEHIDGPLMFIPFASVYRCIVGLDGNTEVSTIFTLIDEARTAQKGDILAFDFNRESHLIRSDGSKPNKDFRIVLKLHFCVYPRNLAVFGYILQWLNTRYNELFRSLFLYTLVPTGTISTFVGEFFVNGGTIIFNNVHKKLGYQNIFYVFAAYLIAINFNSFEIFLVATQFVHYFRYITTYYIRKNVNYGIFKRDVLFFKTVALLQLGYIVFLPFWRGDESVSNPRHVFCFAVIIAGYFVSVLATKALGVDGTYFGIELGKIPKDYLFVKSFPYNTFPHPMILGQVCSLLGMHAFQWVRDVYFWLIPVHVALYLLHMTQEIYDVHDGAPWYKKLDKGKVKKN